MARQLPDQGSQDRRQPRKKSGSDGIVQHHEAVEPDPRENHSNTVADPGQKEPKVHPPILTSNFREGCCTGRGAQNETKLGWGYPSSCACSRGSQGRQFIRGRSTNRLLRAARQRRGRSKGPVTPQGAPVFCEFT